MSPLSQEEKNFLNMAGEFLVAAELNRRRILSAVTYGAAKSADVWAFDDISNRAVRVEVKATGINNQSWLVGNKAIVRENWNPDIFWVLVLLPTPHPITSETTDEKRGLHAPRFFVFSSEEIGKLMCEEYDRYHAAYLKKHGRKFDDEGGRWTLSRKKAAPFENAWGNLESRVRKTSER